MNWKLALSERVHDNLRSDDMRRKRISLGHLMESVILTVHCLVRYYNANGQKIRLWPWSTIIRRIQFDLLTLYCEDGPNDS